jgi:hypothetical protein
MGALGNLRLSPPTNPDFRPWSTAHHNKFGLASTSGKSSTSLVQFLRDHLKTYFIQSLSVLSLDQPPQSLFSIICLGHMFFWKFLCSWWFGTWRFFSRYGYGSIPISTIFRGMNIHLPAILMFTRGTRVLTHCHIGIVSSPAEHRRIIHSKLHLGVAVDSKLQMGMSMWSRGCRRPKLE